MGFRATAGVADLTGSRWRHRLARRLQRFVRVPGRLIVTNNIACRGAPVQLEAGANSWWTATSPDARRRALGGPGSRVFVTVSVKDVTEDIAGKIDPKTTDRKRYDVVDQRVKAKTAECEKSACAA